MTRTLPASTAALLCSLAVLAGCGGGGSGSSTQSPTGATTSGSAPAPGSSQAVQACKHAIRGRAALSASLKSRLEGLCEKAAHGNEAEIKAAARAACEEVVDKSPLAVGPAKRRALAVCRK